MTMQHVSEVKAALAAVADFISARQQVAMQTAARGEEGEHFVEKARELAAKIKAMPSTYEQDALGDMAIVHLHYFVGGCDWYITEKDKGDGSTDTEQFQAFGYASIGGGQRGELGYISIAELLAHNVELDLYFKPCTLNDLRAKAAA